MKQSRGPWMHSAPDCFAEPVLGRRFAPTRGLAMAARKYPMNLRTRTLSLPLILLPDPSAPAGEDGLNAQEPTHGA